MSSTSTQILDIGQELIQARGESAMSLQDIAAGVGLKNPSVIHHFPSKADLGIAIIRRCSKSHQLVLRLPRPLSRRIRFTPQTSALTAVFGIPGLPRIFPWLLNSGHRRPRK